MVRDIVGLYLDPPDKTLVLCVDEKAQIQALDRTQPVLPMRPGQVERRTHDSTRHGTTTLFAALNAKSGEIIGEFHQRHRPREFRTFLGTINDAVPHRLDVHLMVDNASTHKTPLIHRCWPGIHAFTSTSHRPAARGSTSSSAGLLRSRRSRSVPASIAARASWKPPFAATSNSRMSARGRSCGPRRPTKS
jgi:DDE superfamily endonuclease